jgi:hypothetical protein
MGHRVPTFAEWLELPDAERTKIRDSWNPYGGEGRELISEVSEHLRLELSHLPLEFSGPGVYHGGQWVIAIRRPFIIDKRELPQYYLGIMVHYSQLGELPPEFEAGRTNEYVWAPEHYERFVDRAGEEIRRTLGKPNLTRDEMLEALTGMPFAEYLREFSDEG